MTRDVSTDLARGIAIIAIVVGHVLRGLALAGIIPIDSATVQFWDRLLYMFHLSVFALLSGLFVRNTVERMGRGAYLRHRSAHFVYLYLLWTVLQGAFVRATSVASPTSPAEFLTGWMPYGQLWFLPFLIEMTIVAAVVRPWRSILRAGITIAVTAAASLALWGLNGPVIGTEGLGIAVFFVAAAAVGPERFLRALRAIHPGMLVATAITAATALSLLVGLTAAVPPASGGEQRTVLDVALGVVASVAGVIAVLAVSRLLSFVPRASAWLGYAGGHSLEIFLAHFIAVTSIRVVLLQLGVTNPAVHIVLGIAIGAGLPLVLGWVCRVIRFPWLFDAPRAFTGETGVVAPALR